VTLKCVVCEYPLTPPRHTFCSLQCVYRGHRRVQFLDKNGRVVMKGGLRKDRSNLRKAA
jgi:hypothetical protein